MSGIRDIVRGQGGIVLPLVLVLLIVGSLLILPALSFGATSLKSGQVAETKAQEMYAADGGIQDALWRIAYQEGFSLPDAGNATSWSSWSMNGKSVEVELYKPTEGEDTYRIRSVATGDGSMTRIESYVQVLQGGNLPIFDGALVSSGNITLGKECTVDGDIWYNDMLTAPDLNHSGNLTHGGVEMPTSEENEQFANELKREAQSGGTHEGDMVISGETTVDLGPLFIDGDLIVKKECTIALGGTVYVSGSVQMDKESFFSGNGDLVAEGDMYLAKEQDFGTDGESMIVSLYGDVTFEKEQEMDTAPVLIYAPNGTVSFKKECVVTGSVVAAGIESGKEGSFTYSPGEGGWGELPGAGAGETVVKTYLVDT